jgi:nicotinamidase-related amidase
MLERSKAVLVVIDVQVKLFQTMDGREQLGANLQRLVKGVEVLGIPVLWLEQNPRGLGPTIPEVAALLSGQTPVSKQSFSCCGSAAFREALAALGRTQVLLAGIEAHVCVYQTALDLLALGYYVEVVADAVSSRTAANCQLGLERMAQAGVPPTSTEMALFELLRVAEGPDFKAILALVR